MKIETDINNLRQELVDFLSSTNRERLSKEHSRTPAYYSRILERLETRKISIKKLIELHKKLIK